MLDLTMLEVQSIFALLNPEPSTPRLPPLLCSPTFLELRTPFAFINTNISILPGSPQPLLMLYCHCSQIREPSLASLVCSNS